MIKQIVFTFIICSCLFSCHNEESTPRADIKEKTEEIKKLKPKYGPYMRGLISELDLNSKTADQYLALQSKHVQKVKSVKQNSNIQNKRKRVAILTKQYDDKILKLLGKSKIELKKKFDEKWRKK